MDSDTFVNTGFSLFTAKEELGKAHIREENLITTNSKCDLYFSKFKEITVSDTDYMKKDDDDDDELDGDNEETYIEGYINITYA